jgi:hypothetical protein
MEQLVGFSWLKHFYHLSRLSLKCISYVGDNEKMEITSNGALIRVFGKKYRIENTPMNHLVFGLKYDYVNLHFLKTIFTKIPTSTILDFINAAPSGIYSRKIGFLYEFLMQQQLDIEIVIVGNYIDLLDSKKYHVGCIVKNSKWKINDNLLGNFDFCPIVRRTMEIDSYQEMDVSNIIKELREDYSVEIFERANNYLYGKETKSSFQIEHEQPSLKRIDRFVALLMKAGKISENEMYLEPNLTLLQNDIVDPRFAVSSYRDFQNYIGQSLPNYAELVHYICPPPEIVASLMRGLNSVATKSKGASALIRASSLSFGFVFIHPFEDGNGRLHRFLIHDTMVRDQVVPDGMIIPVSAHILNNIKDYNAVLEAYSKDLMHLIDYEKLEKGGLKVLNPSEVESFYRYPDLTIQTSFLGKTIQETLLTDMPNELRFIYRYDELRTSIQDIVDMPDKDIQLMIQFLHQNKGVFPKRRRKDFAKITDPEIVLMEQEYQSIFEM